MYKIFMFKVVRIFFSFQENVPYLYSYVSTKHFSLCMRWEKSVSTWDIIAWNGNIPLPKGRFWSMERQFISFHKCNRWTEISVLRCVWALTFTTSDRYCVWHFVKGLFRECQGNVETLVAVDLVSVFLFDCYLITTF